MKKLMIGIAAVALCFGTQALSYADQPDKGDDQDGHSHEEAVMPPMGPPQEMKELEALNGKFKVKFFYKVDPTNEAWTESDATAEVSMVVGGGAQQMLFEGEMMGMPMSGIGMTSYDRETKQWQMTWVDSMGARISVYGGGFTDGEFVVTGKDLAEGITYHSRLTTYNITEKGFDWKYEMSMDGTNYMETAKATYTKR